MDVTRLVIPPLPRSTILLVEVGSTAHGTGRSGQEDRDEMGIVVESPFEVLGLTMGRKNVMQRTQPDGVRSGPGDTDRSLYSLRNFLRLAAAGNPSVMMALWAPVLMETPLGMELREIAPAFIGRHMIPRYRGYMQSQALRLLGVKGAGGHGTRGSGRREELINEYGYDTKFAMHASRLGFQCIELLQTGELKLPIEGEPAQWLVDVRYGLVPFEEWWERTLWLDQSLEMWLEETEVPAEPDRLMIENFSYHAHMTAWAGDLPPHVWRDK